MALLISSSCTNTGSIPPPSERNTRLRDVSFSSYLSSSEEDRIRTLAQSSLNFRISNQPKNNTPKPKDGEIDIFGAQIYLNDKTPQERYSKGGTLTNNTVPKNDQHEHEHEYEQSQSPSWNSQSGVLRHISKAIGIRNLFFRCYSCGDTSYILIHGPPADDIDVNHVNTDHDDNNFVFPVPAEAPALSRVVAPSDHINLSWPWAPTQPAAVDMDDDEDDNRPSDASSDLFELQIFHLEAQAVSEATSDWSLEERDKQKRSISDKKSRPRALLGCVTQKAIRLMHKVLPAINTKVLTHNRIFYKHQTL